MDKFLLGRLVVTPCVGSDMSNNTDFAKFIAESLKRFSQTDWGKLRDADGKQNENALKTGDERIIGSYEHPVYSDWAIWIITESDHKTTTILYPEEY